MKALLILCIGIAILALFAAGYGFFRTWKTGMMPEYAEFTQGSVPSAVPQGLWNGTAEELGDVSWKGKKFLTDEAGINLFEKNGVKSEAYPFMFSVVTGFDAPTVIRLDYDQPENPWWLRFIVDDMVSVGEKNFLGIVYIKVVPGFPFRMGYFRLEK